jgi:hypothetical protein
MSRPDNWLACTVRPSSLLLKLWPEECRGILPTPLLLLFSALPATAGLRICIAAAADGGDDVTVAVVAAVIAIAASGGCA